jgi:hypothetical protein
MAESVSRSPSIPRSPSPPTIAVTNVINNNRSASADDVVRLHRNMSNRGSRGGSLNGRSPFAVGYGWTIRSPSVNDTSYSPDNNEYRISSACSNESDDNNNNAVILTVILTKSMNSGSSNSETASNISRSRTRSYSPY